jgi:hypothetical protein
MLIPIPSRSRPGLRHQVYVDPRTGRAVCPCEAYTFSKERPRRCAHSVAALSLVSYAYDTATAER